MVQAIIEKLWEEILKIDEKQYPKLKEWNVHYFTEHQNRYGEDLKLIQALYQEGEILEIGSLPCHLTFCLKELNYPVTGIDLDPSRCEFFIQKNNLNIKKCDIEHEPLPFKDNAFDLILFNETFEHLRINPIEPLKEIRRVLKPKGLMILTTPNLYSLRNIVLFNLGRGFNDAYEEFKKLEWVGHMGHIREYSCKEMVSFLEHTGFEILEIQFKTYNPSKKKIVGPLINGIHRLIKKIRPFQVILCKKA